MDLFAHGPDHLTADVAGLLAGEPGHHRGAAGRIEAVELVVGDLVGLAHCAPDIVAEIRVMPPGPITFAVTPSLATSGG
jgi:hypothetical protein